MAWMEVLAPAKVNLFLELIERRSDGFHELETIMASVNLFDRLLLRRRPDDQISLSLAGTGIKKDTATFSMPEDGTNLVWRAIDLQRQNCKRNFGLDVLVQKRIPNQAGMGGGSSDAAATLLAVNRMFGLNQSREQLRHLAQQLGSDVAFFVDNGMARCTGRGEIIQPLPSSQRLDLVMVMPPAGLSTAEVYQHSQLPAAPRPSEPLAAALRLGQLRRAGAALWNRLQSAAISLSPWIGRLQREFARLNCVGHQMTGSGAAYFGLFANGLVARRAANLLATRLPECFCFCVSTVGRDANLIRYRTD